MTNRDSSYVELYDIAADPYEKNDLKTERPEEVAALLKRIDEWKATLPEQPSGDVFSVQRSR